MEQVTRIELAS